MSLDILERRLALQMLLYILERETVSYMQLRAAKELLGSESTKRSLLKALEIAEIIVSSKTSRNHTFQLSVKGKNVALKIREIKTILEN